MDSLRKIFGAVLLLTFLILPQIVSAEKTDWKDSNYNFGRVRTVVLLNINSEADLRRVSNAVQMKVEGDYLNSSRKLKCQVLTEDQARRMLGITNASQDRLKSSLSDIADMWIECDIRVWKDSYYIVPARTVWEEKKRTRKIRNRWGYWEEESYYESVPVTYPPYRVDTSDIIADFEAHDARTGRVVFTREDNRSRNDAQAQKDMFGRMCNSFFEDLGKRIK